MGWKLYNSGGKPIGGITGFAGDDLSYMTAQKEFRTMMTEGGDYEDYQAGYWHSGGFYTGSFNIYDDVNNTAKVRMKGAGFANQITNAIFPRYGGTDGLGRNYLGIKSDTLSIGETTRFKDDCILLQFDTTWTGNWGGALMATMVEIIHDDPDDVDANNISNQGVVLWRDQRAAIYSGSPHRWDIPLSHALEKLNLGVPPGGSNANPEYRQLTQIKHFKIQLSWWKVNSSGGSTGEVAPQIRVSEMRMVKGMKASSINAGAVTLGNQVTLLAETYATTLQRALRVTGHVSPALDNTYDLGENGSNVRKRWDDIHATNGVIQTSDRRNKLEITGSNLGLDFVNSLNPVSFKWKETRNRNSWEIQNLTSGSRTHYGLIAQDLSSSLASAGVNTQQFAGITINPATTQVEPDGTIVENYAPWGIRYNELISPMIKSIQELSEEVSRLKLLISGSGD